VEVLAQPVAVEHPRGFHSARVDEKGRLKLPAVIQQYLNRLGESQVFITTLDGRTGRIYPISVWRENEIVLRDAGEDAEQAEDLWFIANAYGADAEVDGQGRLLVPTELRRLLDIEGQQVHLEYYKGHVNIYTQAVFDEKKARASDRLGDKLKLFEKKGLR
jgi:MraZ protein